MLMGSCSPRVVIGLRVILPDSCFGRVAADLPLSSRSSRRRSTPLCRRLAGDAISPACTSSRFVHPLRGCGRRRWRRKSWPRRRQQHCILPYSDRRMRRKRASRASGRSTSGWRAAGCPRSVDTVVNGSEDLLRDVSHWSHLLLLLAGVLLYLKLQRCCTSTRAVESAVHNNVYAFVNLCMAASCGDVRCGSVSAVSTEGAAFGSSASPIRCATFSVVEV